MPRTGRPPKHLKEVRTCQHCERKYEAYPYAGPKRFCTPACYYASRVGKKYPVPVREMRPCRLCGKLMTIGGGGNRRANAMFCSQPCAVNGRWEGVPGHEPARAMSDVEIAWFAGVFDGEGGVAWPRRTKVTSVRLSITNTSRPLLEKVIEVVGTGRLLDRTRFRKSLKHSPVWVWSIYGENAQIVLRQILPWLIVKREAAEVALGIRKVAEPPLTLRSRTTLAALEAETT